MALLFDLPWHTDAPFGAYFRNNLLYHIRSQKQRKNPSFCGLNTLMILYIVDHGASTHKKRVQMLKMRKRRPIPAEVQWVTASKRVSDRNAKTVKAAVIVAQSGVGQVLYFQCRMPVVTELVSDAGFTEEVGAGAVAAETFGLEN